ncbi:histone H1 [Carex littledalei]|uniref:Histone H1 n=1 Tax=Carex littledalei TaxID=544730 RepID=A0A833VFZ4_9POAL|nr:histone H1 [Carex littledalei]
MESSVALPSPAIAAKPRLHPPYKEMILTAVVSLNERGGSSKRAISKFIKTTYIHLPMKHDALLACHLRRLRTEGALHMLRHSYKLSPRSKLNLAPSVATSRPRGRPKKVPETSQLSVGLSGKLAVKRAPGRPPKSLAVKRGPGRPPKSQLLAPNKQPGRPPKIQAVKRGPGRPPKILAVKKRPGRPPKIPAVGMAKMAPNGASKRGRPPKSKKGPGRPRKESVVQLQGGKKRKGAGRPKMVENRAPPVMGEKKRGPGRPKMVENGAPHVMGEKRKGPGRPKTVENGAPPVMGEKRKGPGRPKTVENGEEKASAEIAEKKGPGDPKGR